jgi:DNA-binding transcriptional LysR family regulator
MANIDFEWYRSFLAVYRAGTVTLAAEARTMTQPAISQHLAALEAALGDKLFVRLPRRMMPTDRGKALYVEVVQALEQLEQVSQRFGAQPATEPLVRLGAPVEYFAEVAQPRLAHAALRLWVRFGVAPDLIASLVNNEADIVIATQRVAAPAVEYSRLEEEHFCLVGAPSRAAEVRRVSLAQLEAWLSDQPWISYGNELPIIRRFWQQVFGHRPQFQPAQVIPDLRLIAQAVGQEQGISVLPEYMCRRAVADQQLAVLWQPEAPVTNDLWLAYRKVDRQRAELKLVRRLLLGQALR